MNHAFRFVAAQFAAEADARPPGGGFAAWLHAKLVETAEEAEIGAPSWDDGAWVLWLDIGGDRFRIALTCRAPEWALAVEHRSPTFVRGHEGHARHQARFDVLVAQLRTIVLQAQGARLLAESDD